MTYKEINLSFEGFSVQLRIIDPSLIKYYEEDRERFERYVKLYIKAAEGDIRSKGLDSLIDEINRKFCCEKIGLLKDAQREQKNKMN